MQVFDGEKQVRRVRNPEATQQDILAAALVEFSDHGLSGARVDAIAARTRTTVRMIYYYFGSKDGLYQAVLEQSYAAMRRAEGQLRLHDLSPVAAITRLVEFIFDYQEAHPEFTRLVTIENIHRAEHIARSETIQALNEPVLASIASILERGRRQGSFLADVAPIGLHMLMTAFCFFRVSNRHTLGTIFRQDPLSPELRAEHRRMIVAAVLGFLQQAPSGSAAGHLPLP
jgi:AcrR family transcriptional regulator